MYKWLALVLLASTACAYHSPVAPTPPEPISTAIPYAVTLNAVVGQGAEGGHAVVTARVQNVNGAALAEIPVSFTTDTGDVTPALVVTAANGTAATTITAASSANVTAQAGGVTTRLLVASEPFVPPFVPPANPPAPPAPTPPAPVPSPPFEPAPPVPPSPFLPAWVDLTANAPSVPMGGTLTFTALLSPLAPGELPVVYQWDLDGVAGFEATTVGNSRTSAPYLTQGAVTAKVTVTLNTGRTTSDTVGFFVTN